MELANSGTIAALANGTQKVAFAAAITRSQCKSSVTPIPIAGPLTAATSGFGKASIACMNRKGGREEMSTSSESDMATASCSWISAPDEKYLPSLVRTTAPTASSMAAEVSAEMRAR